MFIKYPFLIDGGLSNQLEDQGCNLDHRLWTAKLLRSDPESIINAHLAYLKAGAECITTSSYQASIPGFLREGYSRSEAEIMIRRTVELAVEAVDRFTNINITHHRPLIAASIGPYGAYLADGSEYRGDYGKSKDDLIKFHKSRMDILDSTEADILACETIPDLREAEALCELLEDVSKKAWISFACRDGSSMNDGTPLEKCVEMFAGQRNIFAIGVNCTSPEYISELIDILKISTGEKKIVVYPNSGEVYLPESKTWSGLTDPGSCELMGKEWLKRGADIIGGCCRIGPEHIHSFHNTIKNLNR